MHPVLHIQYQNWQCLAYTVGIISEVVEWGAKGWKGGRQVRPPPDSRVKRGGKMDLLKIMIFCSQKNFQPQKQIPIYSYQMYPVLHIQYQNWQNLAYTVGIISEVVEGSAKGWKGGRQVRPPPDSRVKRGDKMDLLKITIFCSQKNFQSQKQIPIYDSDF